MRFLERFPDHGDSTNPTGCIGTVQTGKMYDQWRSEQCKTLIEQATGRQPKFGTGAPRVDVYDAPADEYDRTVPERVKAAFYRGFDTPMGKIEIAEVSSRETHGHFTPTSGHIKELEESSFVGPKLIPRYKYWSTTACST
jgi:hypothetical protein